MNANLFHLDLLLKFLSLDNSGLSSLIEYMEELKQFNCIWLATTDGEFGEIIITENLTKLLLALAHDHWELKDGCNFYVQEYQTYEDAYKVALDMREGNPKCYN